MRLPFKMCKAAYVAALLFLSPGFVQAADDAARLDRLERDMLTLQRQTFRNQGSGAPVESPRSIPLPPPGELEPTAAAAYELRLQELQQQIEALTGQVEELTYKNDRLNEQVEKMKTDYDFRFSQMEGRTNAPTSTPANTPEPAPASRAPERVEKKPPPANDLTKLGPGQNAASNLPEKLTPEQLYDQALSHLRQNDYEIAEGMLSDFLKANPKHTLAENAQYWLAETYYVRGKYAKASVEFASGYKSFPKGVKAPDNLLKLGLSLDQLNNTAESCKTYAKLLKDYQKADQAVLKRAKEEQEKLGCQ